MMETVKEGVNKFTTVLGSASKLVLLAVTGTLCAALFTGHVDATLFEKALLLILGFYFGSNTVSGKPETK